MLSLSQSFTISESLSGSLRVFSFVVAKGLSRHWNRTCFYLSDPQRLSLCGSLWIADGLCLSFSCVSICSFTIFHGLSQNCATHKDPQKLYGNQALVQHLLTQNKAFQSTVSEKPSHVQHTEAVKAVYSLIRNNFIFLSF